MAGSSSPAAQCRIDLMSENNSFYTQLMLSFGSDIGNAMDDTIEVFIDI